MRPSHLRHVQAGGGGGWGTGCAEARRPLLPGSRVGREATLCQLATRREQGPEGLVVPGSKTWWV